MCCCALGLRLRMLEPSDTGNLNCCFAVCRRKDNLAARAATKLENKKAKREKKLLRAGFEGRKAGFINAPKSK